MNLNIIKLALQLQEESKKYSTQGFEFNLDKDSHRFFAQALTELVVNESCKILSNWKNEPFPFDENLAVSLIKEHFGVK